MKEFLLKHKKIYYAIVIAIALISFVAITLHGVKKANAEVDYGSVSIPYGDSSVYALSLRDYPYYVVFTNVASDIEEFIALLSDEPMTYGNGYSDTGLLSVNGRVLYVRREKNVYGEYNISEQVLDGGFAISYLPQDSSWVYSNYDVMRGPYEVVFSSDPLPFSASFSMEYPYFRFKELDMRNKLYNGEIGLGLELDEIYTKLSAQSTWTYNGYIENYQGYENCDMFLNLNVTLSLPSIEWLEQQFNSTTTSGTTYAKWSQDIIYDWYLQNDVPKDNYNFDMPMPITPSSDGQFSFSLSYNELMTYIKYNYEDFKHTVNDMSLCTQGLYASLIHISDLRGSVVTKSNGVDCYGRFTHNEFVKGDEKTCLEVIPNENYYDMTEDEFDDYFENIYKDAHEDYMNQLQNQIDDLQNQIDNMQTIDGAFGNLGASDLWTGFTGTVKGVSQLGASVGTLSAMVGSVLAFLPLQMGSYMAFTLFAILVIAIIKAIRG